jgi:hypothetical protein
MKKVITIFYVFIHLSQLLAQEGFIKAYDFDNPTAVRFNAMLLDDSELIVCGFINDSVPPYQTGIFFSKIDTLGEVLNFTTYHDSLGYSYVPGANPGGLIKLEDNSGYLFTGTVFQGADGFLSKWDLEGNLVWLKRLEDSTSLQGFYHSLLETESGFLIGAHKQIPITASSTIDISLIKTDKQGDVQWEQQYGETWNGDLLNSLLKKNNNEYVLGGLKGAGGTQENTEVQIFAVDSLGEEKWYWQSNTPLEPGTYENIGCFGLNQDEEGNWAYATRRNVNQTVGVWFVQGIFVVRDSNFNLITERVYDEADGQQNHFLNLVPLSDGDWLGLGVSLEEVANSNPPFGHN